MSQNALLEEFKEFLKSVKLSNYEIRGYLTLLKTEILNARELGKKARIPIGRIYDVLDRLNELGMIEIQESRPKVYKAVSPITVFNSLVSHYKAENRRKTDALFNQAKTLEAKVTESKIWFKEEVPGTFWSTAFGSGPVMSLYVKKLDELQEELLMTGFLNKDTIQVLPFGRDLFMGLLRALNRGVKLKFLWSFEFDQRPLTEMQRNEASVLYQEFKEKLKALFNLSSELEGLEMKFIYRMFPTYYDIFDKKRVFIKLQNPIKSGQIFACLNVLDLNLAKELSEKFLTIWSFEAVTSNFNSD